MLLINASEPTPTFVLQKRRLSYLQFPFLTIISSAGGVLFINSPLCPILLFILSSFRSSLFSPVEFIFLLVLMDLQA